MKHSLPRSRALRRRHCAGGGAPVNFGRRQRRAPVQKCRRPQKIFSEGAEKISFYPHNFLMTFFSNLPKICPKNTAKMASAARRQIMGGGSASIKKVGGSGANNCRRRHAAARPGPALPRSAPTLVTTGESRLE